MVFVLDIVGWRHCARIIALGKRTVLLTAVVGLLKFVFHGGTNFDPAVDAHFHEGTFRIRDANTVESTFVVHAGGEAQPEGSSVLTRRAE